MSKPATSEQVAFVAFVAFVTWIVVIILAWGIISEHKRTRRCIVESRNSVEVPEVCK